MAQQRMAILEAPHAPSALQVHILMLPLPDLAPHAQLDRSQVQIVRIPVHYALQDITKTRRGRHHANHAMTGNSRILQGPLHVPHVLKDMALIENMDQYHAMHAHLDHIGHQQTRCAYHAGQDQPQR